MLHLLTLLLVSLTINISYAETPQSVTVKKLSEISFKQQYSYPASAISLQQVVVSSKLEGNIDTVNVGVGSQVIQNDNLARIDCTELALSKQQAIATLARLKANKLLTQQQLKRAKKLVSINSISDQELEQNQTALDANIASVTEQQVALNIIETRIEKCDIKAPFNGVITQKQAMQGLYVLPGSALFTLVNPQTIEVAAQIPLNQSASIQSASSIEFIQNGQHYPVRIQHLLPIADEQTNQQMVRLSFSGEKKPIANSQGKIQWLSQTHSIPAAYIVQRKQQLGIFIAQNNRAQFHPLLPALEGQASQADLPENTLVIIDKLLILKDNDEVSVSQ